MRPGLTCCWLCREIQGWERERRKRQIRGKRTSWDRQACQDFPFRKAKSLQSAQIRRRSGFLKERGFSRSPQRISRKFLLQTQIHAATFSRTAFRNTWFAFRAAPYRRWRLPRIRRRWSSQSIPSWTRSSSVRRRAVSKVFQRLSRKAGRYAVSCRHSSQCSKPSGRRRVEYSCREMREKTWRIVATFCISLSDFVHNFRCGTDK